MHAERVPWYVQIFYMTGILAPTLSAVAWIGGDLDPVVPQFVFAILGSVCLGVGISRFMQKILTRRSESEKTD
jgi:hypothetical protein